MEADQPIKKTVRDSSDETNADAGAYVSPEIVAAAKGDQVDFGTTIEDKTED